MNKIALTLAASVCALATFADAPAPVAAASRPARRPARLVKPSGGLVEKAYAGVVLRVFNAQAAVEPGVVATAVEFVRRHSRIPLVFESAPTAPAGVPAWKTARALAAAKDKTGATVLVTSDPELPFLTGSPDERWAILNVAAAAGDAARTPDRVTKLVWHAAALALGVGGVADGGVLAPFSKLEGLDRLATEPGPMSHNAFVDAARARGMGFVTLATYRTACEEGWAPAPTNDVQKAIWEKVHAMPTAPMKIAPETQKVKD